MKFKEFAPEIKIGEEQLSESESRIYDFLVPEHQASAIKMEEFSDLYHEGVELDKALVEEKRRHFSETFSAKRGKIAEALLSEQAELSEWLGKDAMTIVPSEFDDFINGVDIAVEFEREEGFKHLALGLDITSSAREIRGKLLEARKHISKGDLTKIKYFISEKSHIRGEISKIPWLLIGIDKKMLRELCDLRLTQMPPPNEAGLSEETRKRLSEERMKARKALAEHRVRNLILEELEMQLKFFMEFADKNNQEAIAGIFENLLELISSLLREAPPLSPKNAEANETSEVLKTFREELPKLFGREIIL